MGQARPQAAGACRHHTMGGRNASVRGGGTGRRARPARGASRQGVIATAEEVAGTPVHAGGHGHPLAAQSPDDRSPQHPARSTAVSCDAAQCSVSSCPPSPDAARASPGAVSTRATSNSQRSRRAAAFITGIIADGRGRLGRRPALCGVRAACVCPHAYRNRLRRRRAAEAIVVVQRQ